MLGAWSSCLSQDSSNRARPDPADPEKKHLQYLDKMSQLRVHLGIPKRTCSPNLQNGDGRTRMGSGFSGVFLADSQVSRRFPRFHLKNRRTFTLFTKLMARLDAVAARQRVSSSQLYAIELDAFNHIMSYANSMGSMYLPALCYFYARSIQER